MKWHNIGPGHVQLRLLVAILDNAAYLCNAYVKDDDITDFREMGKLKQKFNISVKEELSFEGGLYEPSTKAGEPRTFQQ